MPQFRDPVHGFIFVSEDEQKIIDSPPFQRLRNIRQLATTYLVYHGAEHTRFGHSIGVMHLVTKVFDTLVEKTPNLFRADTLENNAVVKWYRQILRLIALTHDLGHAPFSHASEELFPNGFEHEDYTRKILEETVIGEYITEIGEKLQVELAILLGKPKDHLYTNRGEEKYSIRPITPQILWMIYGEKPDIQNENYIWPDFVFLKSFMDGELDCDKMDYLLRDSLFCGVTYGKYDLERLISTLTVYKNERENSLSLAVVSSGIQAFEEFVLARYFMFIQVYFHKTRRILDRLLAAALKEILPHGKYPEAITEYQKWDDVKVIETMRQSSGEESKKFLCRDIMSCIYETPAHSSQSGKQIVNMLLEFLKMGFSSSKFFCDEVDKKAHKLLPTAYSSDDDSGKEIKLIDRHTGEAKNIMDESLILQSIVDKIRICRIYTDFANLDEQRKFVRDKLLARGV